MAGRLFLTSASLLTLALANPILDNRNAPTTTTRSTSTASKSSTTTSASSTCRTVERDANFDDLTGVVGNELNPIPTPYMSLDFQGFQYSQVLSPGTGPGVVPHSPSNYAVASVVTETGGTPMLSVYYSNSTLKSFSLENFYFGCVDNLGNAAAAAAAACNIEVTGYRGSDNSVSNAQQVCAQQFQYNPSTALAAQQMAFSGAVNGCQNIQFAIVTFSPPGGAAATQADLVLLLDDIRYSTCS